MSRMRVVEQATGRIAVFKVDVTEKLVEWAVYLSKPEVDDLHHELGEFLNPKKEEKSA